MTTSRTQSKTRATWVAGSAYIAFATIGALAQQPVAQPASKPAAFDVVSIKPSGQPLQRGGAWGVSRNEYTAKNTPLIYVILQAYLGDMAASSERLKGAPSWVTDEPYDIVAKADDETANSWKGLQQARQIAIAAPMLRTMLEDRCKLVEHSEPTQLDAYALVRADRPLKLKEYQPNEALPKNHVQFQSGLIMSYSDPGTDAQPFTSFYNASMADFAALLGMGGPQIIDQTGLNSHYDFTLARLDAAPSAAQDGSAAPPAPRPDAAHLFDWKSVGLELKPIKVPGFNVVIDHIERPTAN